MRPITICPSILNANFLHLAEQINTLVAGGIRTLHLDIMDGHFVPNLSFGASIVASIRKKYPQLILDVHLMLSKPEAHIDAFVDAGAHIISVHVEASAHGDALLSRIKKNGVHAGIALNPGTPICMIKPLLPLVERVVVMSVNPGFGGQKLIAYTLDKVRALRAIAQEKNYTTMGIQIDGGVHGENIAETIAAGADLIVVGSYLFSAPEQIKERLQKLQAHT